MAHLTWLPPELLLHILYLLPIRSLLAFSLVSRSTYDFASSSLHTLSLGIYPTRMSSLVSQLSSTRSATSSCLCSARNVTSSEPIPLLFRAAATSSEPFSEARTVIHVIPKASELQPRALLAFHNALTSSILNRYSVGMRHLELNIWTLTSTVADALGGMKNLRTLCLRIEDPSGYGFLRRSVTRWGGTTADTGVDTDAVGQEHENRSLRRITRGLPSFTDGTEWNKFAGAWSSLETLRLVGAEVSDWQLGRMLESNAQLKELWLEKCPNIGIELLETLCEEWDGNDSIQTLGLVDYDRAATINAQTVTRIKKLSNLQFLSLLGCRGLMNKTVERLNNESWHIPHVDFPDTHTPDIGSIATVIEVNPAYMLDNA